MRMCCSSIWMGSMRSRFKGDWICRRRRRLGVIRGSFILTVMMSPSELVVWYGLCLSRAIPFLISEILVYCTCNAWFSYSETLSPFDLSLPRRFNRQYSPHFLCNPSGRPGRLGTYIVLGMKLVAAVSKNGEQETLSHISESSM